MDEPHLLAAVRYIEQNPVRAGLVKRPEEYQWSSCRVHLKQVKDPLVKIEPLLAYTDQWEDFMNAPVAPAKTIISYRVPRILKQTLL